MTFLADHRIGPLTVFFQACSFLGTVEGYVLLIAMVFVIGRKSLAYRVATITLGAMSLNHLIKSIVKNPRPFIEEGSHLERWTTWGEDVGDLATEYSTPSGHAMAAAACYLFLFSRVRTPMARFGCLAMVLLTGLSRPYLGVHYFEDVALGWAIGGVVAVVAVRFDGDVSVAWRRLGATRQIALVVVGGAASWVLTRLLLGGDEPPVAFVAYAGFLLGAVVGFPLERRLVGIDFSASPPGRKVLAWLVTAVLVLATLEALDALFAQLAPEQSAFGYLLRYVRYAMTAIVGLAGTSLLLVRLGLGTSSRHDPHHLVGAGPPC